MPSSIEDRFGQGSSTAAAVKLPVKGLSTTDITLSGEQTLNSIALVDGDRWCKAMPAGSVDSGIYIVRAGAWDRAPDFDGSGDVVQGTMILVAPGTDDEQFWFVKTASPIYPGTTSILIERDTLQELALRADLASTAIASDGDALSGVKRTFDGAAATNQHEVNEWRCIYPEDAGAVGDLTTDDTAEVQVALNALESGDRLVLRRNYKLTGAGCTLTDKSDIQIVGPGSLQLIGANADAKCIHITGTCSNVTFDGVRFNGDSNTGGSYFQYGVSCPSGTTLSDVIVTRCRFEGLNGGVLLSAESGGVVTNVIVTHNIIRRPLGTQGGQGYGIFGSKITNFIVANNIITDSDRHAIYVSRGATSAGTEYGVTIEANTIRGHRRNVYDGSVRAAIVVVRQYGGKICGNTVIDYWDGAIAMNQDNVDGTSLGDIEVFGNSFIGRQNAVQTILIGLTEAVTAVPPVSEIFVHGNRFRSDVSVGGAQAEVYISSGIGISFKNNKVYLANIPNGAYRLIEVGQYATSTSEMDRVSIESNEFSGTASGTASLVLLSFVRLATAMCTTDVRLFVRNNNIDTQFTVTNVEYQTARTGKRILDQLPNQQAVGVYTAGDTAPSIWGAVSMLRVINSGATNIDTLSDGVDGQTVRLLFSDSNTTVRHNQGATPFRLVGGANVSGANRTVLTVTYNSSAGAWYEEAFSVNA